MFENSFGKLPEAEKSRILALAAEAKPDWKRAETHWRAAAERFANDGSREGKLSAAVIYRHLAELAHKEPMIEGDGMFAIRSSPTAQKPRLRSGPSSGGAAAHQAYREDGDDKEWRALAEEAAQRFPTESAVLLQAIESAAAGKAYKKAAGFAKKLLAVDPINRPARQRMIELQISHARKQMRSKRPDLAWKELAAAGEWERADAPNADLRINRGLVGLRGGLDPEAEARLREGVDLAGGGAPGWFRAALQDALMTPPRERHVAPIDEELARALRGVASKPEIVAIAALLAAEDVRADPKATSELNWKFCNGLRKATHIVLSAAEFHSVADAILARATFRCARRIRRRRQAARAERALLALLRDRRPHQNDPERMYVTEEEEIEEMCESRAIAEDRLGRSRIDRYLDGSGDDPGAKQRARRREADEEAEGLECHRGRPREFPGRHSSAGRHAGSSGRGDGRAAQTN